MTSPNGPGARIVDNVTWPCPVDVEIAGGGRWVPANALAVRVERRGPQVLISYGGHQMWVSARRVRIAGPDPTATGEDPAT